MGNTGKVITVSINGINRQIQATSTAASLVIELGLQDKRVALERNGEIVPRSRFEIQQLSEGDKLEIVVAVGGG